MCKVKREKFDFDFEKYNIPSVMENALLLNNSPLIKHGEINNTVIEIMILKALREYLCDDDILVEHYKNGGTNERLEKLIESLGIYLKADENTKLKMIEYSLMVKDRVIGSCVVMTAWVVRKPEMVQKYHCFKVIGEYRVYKDLEEKYCKVTRELEELKKDLGVD